MPGAAEPLEEPRSAALSVTRLRARAQPEVLGDDPLSAAPIRVDPASHFCERLAADDTCDRGSIARLTQGGGAVSGLEAGVEGGDELRVVEVVDALAQLLLEPVGDVAPVPEPPLGIHPRDGGGEAARAALALGQQPNALARATGPLGDRARTDEILGLDAQEARRARSLTRAVE